MRGAPNGATPKQRTASPSTSIHRFQLEFHLFFALDSVLSFLCWFAWPLLAARVPVSVVALPSVQSAHQRTTPAPFHAFLIAFTCFLAMAAVAVAERSAGSEDDDDLSQVGDHSPRHVSGSGSGSADAYGHMQPSAKRKQVRGKLQLAPSTNALLGATIVLLRSRRAVHVWLRSLVWILQTDRASDGQRPFFTLAFGWTILIWCMPYSHGIKVIALYGRLPKSALV